MLIIFNGPPRAGKTTSADILAKMGVHSLVLTEPFARAACEMLDHQFTGEDKDVRIRNLPGFDWLEDDDLTLRQVMIDLANLGETWDPCIWIKLAVQGADFVGGDVTLDSLGKIAQWDWIVRNVPLNCLGLISVSRPGCDWTDGRESITPAMVPSGCAHAFIDNSGSIDDLREFLDAVMTRWGVK